MSFFLLDVIVLSYPAVICYITQLMYQIIVSLVCKINLIILTLLIFSWIEQDIIYCRNWYLQSISSLLFTPALQF